jgi:hypothetical protein
MFNSINKRPFPDSNWVNFRTESVIIGWSTITTAILLYKIINDIIYVIYRIEGTSNSTDAYFSIPVQTSVEQEKVITGGVANPGGRNTNIRYYFSCVSVDNNTTRDGYVWVFKATNGTVLSLFSFDLPRKGIIVNGYSSVSSYVGWTNTGTKTLNGQFFMPL